MNDISAKNILLWNNNVLVYVAGCYLTSEMYYILLIIFNKYFIKFLP